MVENYFQVLADQIGINLWLLVIIIIWSAIWKMAALWKSARKDQITWFILLAVVNTVGILEILYIYVFSEMKKTPKTEKAPKKRSRKR
ncbi:MAG: DUF5652 family protein [Nanoarchaeota archaeon]|nr:DUF5652 family protein [Nanoarchaeota archaeon]